MNNHSMALLQEYDDILMQRRKLFSSNVFTSNSKQNERIISEFLQVVFREYMQWTPADVYSCLTYDILEQFKLAQLLPYIRYPKEVNPKQDIYYLVGLVYPSYRMTDRERCLKIYTELQKGILKKYPKGFFTGALGEQNAKVCLRHAISETMSFDSVRQMYEYFMTNGIAFFRDHQLFAAYSENWTDPLDFLHDSLADSQKSEQFLHYFRAKRHMKKIYTDLTMQPSDCISVKTVKKSRAYKFYKEAMSRPDEKRKDWLAYLFGDEGWSSLAVSCLRVVLCEEPMFRGLSIIDLLDFFISDEGEEYLIEKGFERPLRVFGAADLFQACLSTRERYEEADSIAYAKKLYEKTHPQPDSSAA